MKQTILKSLLTAGLLVSLATSVTAQNDTDSKSASPMMGPGGTMMNPMMMNPQAYQQMMEQYGGSGEGQGFPGGMPMNPRQFQHMMGQMPHMGYGMPMMGYGYGMGHMMMHPQMMQSHLQHMQRMEQHMEKVESLLTQILEAQ